MVIVRIFQSQEIFQVRYHKDGAVFVPVDFQAQGVLLFQNFLHPIPSIGEEFLPGQEIRDRG